MENKNYESEDQLLADCILHISQKFPQLRGKVWHTENEGYLTIKEGESKVQFERRRVMVGAKSKSKGKLAGIPDILILHNGILWKIELKLPGGSVSDSQKELHEIWNRDCPAIPVQVFRRLVDVLEYCENVILKSKLRVL